MRARLLDCGCVCIAILPLLSGCFWDPMWRVVDVPEKYLPEVHHFDPMENTYSDIQGFQLETSQATCVVAWYTVTRTTGDKEIILHARVDVVETGEVHTFALDGGPEFKVSSYAPRPIITFNTFCGEHILSFPVVSVREGLQKSVEWAGKSNYSHW